MPTKNRVGLDDLGHFRQGFLSQLGADLGQGLPLTATQREQGDAGEKG